MKTYRQPFYKTYAMLYVGTYIISFIIVLPIIIERFNNALSKGVPMDYLVKTLLCFFLPVSILVIFIAMYSSFYVTLSSKGIEIINGIIPLIRKNYGCQDIRKVEIGNKGGFSQNYIQVTKADKTKSIFLVIGLISKGDCTRLANDITSCEIDVEVNGHLK